MTFRGETVGQYVEGVHQTLLKNPSLDLPTSVPQKHTANIQERFMYNPTFESVYSIVPSVPALLLLLIPALLGLPALAVLRRRLQTEAHDIAACVPGDEVELLGRGKVRVAYPGAVSGSRAGPRPTG